MSDPVLAQRITDLLESLGDHPDAVAESLRAKGIKGWKRDGCQCPIAMLLLREFPEIDGRQLLVDDSFVHIGPLGHAVHVSTTPAVSEFIAAFDAGAYPDLIEEAPS